MKFPGRLIISVSMVFFITWIYTVEVFRDGTHSLLKSRKANHSSTKSEASREVPMVYVITPTNKRLEQKAELTRLSYTLRHVPYLHWILVEDSKFKTKLVSYLLKTSQLSYTHLKVATPEKMRVKGDEDPFYKPRGIPQRNLGLKWIRLHSRRPAVVYFADDDNTYDIRVFEEMRYTEKASVWPVAFVSTLMYESPICKGGKVTGWYTTFAPDRKFATDMAGFAVNVRLINSNPNVWFKSHPGYMETDFLSNLGLELTDLEAKANNCTQILVWHTRAERPIIRKEAELNKQHGGNLTRIKEF